MKRQQATIKLALRNEQASDGTHKVVLRVQWQGKRSDLTLPIALNPTEWNEDKQEVRKNNNNSKILNVTLNGYKEKAVKVRDSFILNNQTYTAKQIIDGVKQNDRTANKSHSLKSVMMEYLKDTPNPFALNTINQYKQSINNFLSFLKVDDIAITSITKKDCDNWLNYLSKSNDIKSDNTRRRYSVCVRTVFAYGVEHKYITDVPFTYIDRYSPNKRFARVEHPKALTVTQYKLLTEYYYYVRGHSKTFERNLFKPCSKEFILNFFLCGCNLQGLSPIDLLKLGTKDIIKRTTDKIIFEVKRTKTGKRVILTLYLHEYKMMFDRYINRLNEGKELLFPLFDGVNLNDNVTVTNKMKDFIQCASTNLKKVWKEFNEWLKDKVTNSYGQSITVSGEVINSSDGQGVKLNDEKITLNNIQDYYIQKGITLYSYRHTFATISLIKGRNAYDLARDLGRTVANIDEYIGTLPQSQELRDIERFQLMNS